MHNLNSKAAAAACALWLFAGGCAREGSNGNNAQQALGERVPRADAGIDADAATDANDAATDAQTDAGSAQSRPARAGSSPAGAGGADARAGRAGAASPEPEAGGGAAGAGEEASGGAAGARAGTGGVRTEAGGGAGGVGGARTESPGAGGRGSAGQAAPPEPEEDPSEEERPDAGAPTGPTDAGAPRSGDGEGTLCEQIATACGGVVGPSAEVTSCLQVGQAGEASACSERIEACRQTCGAPLCQQVAEDCPAGDAGPVHGCHQMGMNNIASDCFGDGVKCLDFCHEVAAP